MSDNMGSPQVGSPSVPGAGRADLLEKLLLAAALLIALIHCTQKGLQLGGDGGLTVTPADMLLPIAFLLLLADRIRRRDFLFWKAIPLSAALLIVWSAVSIFLAAKVGGTDDFAITPDRKSGIKDIIQLLQLLVAVYLIYYVAFNGEGRVRLLMWALFAGAAVSVVWAYAQYFSGASAMNVRAGFGNRNVLAAYLAVMIPLFLGYSLCSGRMLLSALSLALAAAALGVITSGGQFIALAAGIVAAAWFFNRKAALPALLVIFAGFIFILPRMPRDNKHLFYESLALYRVEDKAGALEGRQEWAAEDAGRRHARQRDLRRRTMVGDFPDNDELRDLVRQLPGESDYAWPWQQRFQEWQAAMNIIIEYPLFGVGAGAYQANINRFWRRGIPLPEKFPGRSLMEEDALGMYPVRAAVNGLPGLVFLAWLIFDALGRAASAFFKNKGAIRGLAAGCASALVSMTVAGLFTNYLVRGAGITFAIILALAAASAKRKEISE